MDLEFLVFLIFVLLLTGVLIYFAGWQLLIYEVAVIVILIVYHMFWDD